jgi:DNA-binding NtrC family response regulator
MSMKEVIVLDTDEGQRQNLSAFLKNHTYQTTFMDSLADVDQYIDKCDCRAVILNLDNVPVTNKILKDLKSKKPLINIIALSKRQFHPELEEALREYISVCLAEPVDTDELLYWLKSIFENGKEPES